MTELEFTSTFAKKLNVSLADANKSLQVLLDTISAELIKGEKVRLINFGTFEVVDRAPRKGFNPYYRKEVVIPACKEPVFRYGQPLKALLNKEN